MLTAYPTVWSTLRKKWMALVIEEGDLIVVVCPHCHSCFMSSELNNCLDCSKNIPSSGIKEVLKKDGEILKIAVNKSSIPFVNIPPPKTIIKYPIRRKNFTHETKRKKSIKNIASRHAANRMEEGDEELLKKIRIEKKLIQKIQKRKSKKKNIGAAKEVIKLKESKKYHNFDRNKDLKNDFMNENCSSYPSEKQNSIITMDSKSSMPDVPLKAPSIFSSIMALNKKNDIDSANKLKKKEYFFNSSKDQNSVSTSIKERKMSDMSFETPITSVSEDISSDMLLNKKYCTIDKQNLPIIVYGKLVTLKDIKAINNSKIEEYLSGSSKMQTFVNLDNRKRKMSDESNVKPYKCIKLFEINEISNFDSLKKQNIMNLINKPKNPKITEIDLASKKLPDITEGESPSTNAGIIDGSSRPKNIGLFNIKNQDKLIVSKIIKIINFDQSELNSSNNKNVQTQTKHKLSSNKDIKIVSENQTNSEHDVSNNVDVKVVSEDQAQSELNISCNKNSETVIENQTDKLNSSNNKNVQTQKKLKLCSNKDIKIASEYQTKSENNVSHNVDIKVISEVQAQSELNVFSNMDNKKFSKDQNKLIVLSNKDIKITSENQTENEHDVSNNEDQIKNKLNIYINKDSETVNGNQAQSELNVFINKDIKSISKVKTQNKPKLSSKKDVKITSKKQTKNKHKISSIKGISEDQTKLNASSNKQIRIILQDIFKTGFNASDYKDIKIDCEDQIKSKLNVCSNKNVDITSDQTQSELNVPSNENIKDQDQIKNIHSDEDIEVIGEAQSELNVPNDIAVKDNVEDQKENASSYEDNGVINEYQTGNEIKVSKNFQVKKTSHLEYPCVSECDLQCLDENNLINDTVIQFYLGYIYNEKLKKEVQESTHIFNSYFLEKLECRNQTGNTLEKWVRRINIFEKNFIVFPKHLNMGNIGHWFLVVVCFLPMLPKLPEGECDTESEAESDAESKAENDAKLNVENVAETGAEINVENDAESSAESEVRTESQFELQQNSEDSAEDIKRPCICFFDSLDGCAPKLDERKKKVFKDLKYFFKQLWKKRCLSEKEYSLNWSKLLCINAICPQQKNSSDCGVFLLQHAESFFQKPIKKFQDPLDVKHWFNADIISDKRKEIQQIISEKMKSIEKS